MTQEAKATFEDFVNAFDGKVTVIAIKDEREFSTGEKKMFGYKGKTLLPILVKIDSAHSYGYSADDFEDKEEENPTVDEVFNGVESRNGDGCDYILTMETGGVTVTLGDDEAEDIGEDDYEDCDEDGMEYE